MTEEHTYKYTCTNCLEVLETDSFDYPTKCPSCKVGRCAQCGLKLKLSSRFCSNCATVGPTITSGFGRYSNFGTFYMVENWHRRSLEEVQTTTDRFTLKARLHQIKDQLVNGEVDGATAALQELSDGLELKQWWMVHTHRSGKCYMECDITGERRDLTDEEIDQLKAKQ